MEVRDERLMLRNVTFKQPQMRTVQRRLTWRERLHGEITVFEPVIGYVGEQEIHFVAPLVFEP